MGGAVRSGWVEVELGLVSEKAQKVKRKEMLPHVTFLYLDIGGIDNELNRIAGHKTYTWEKAPSRAQQVVKVGDVLFSTVRTYLKNIALVTDQKYEDQICSSGFTVIRGKEKLLESAYALYLSLYEGFLHPLNELQTGSSYPAVRDSDVFAQIIPLPPVPEQRAIVAKIEQLVSRLDYGIASLKVAQEKLATYRQSVLKKVFECGFANIAIEYKPLSNFAELITKGASPSWQGFSYTSDETQLLYITSENVREGYMDFSKRKYLPYEFNKKQKRSMLQKGDVLFNLVGASIGRAAIYNVERIANINQAVSVIRLKKDLVNQYLNYFLNSDVAKQVYLSKKVDVARANLSLKDVNEIEIPYCSIQEQVKIVKEIESRFSVCDHLQQAIEQGMQKAEALRQSVLKKAFEGRLLTETELADCRAMPDWEPAQQLLARIQTEKCAKQNTGKSPVTDKAIVNKF